MNTPPALELSPAPEGPLLRLFQVQDWAYVAAYSLDDAAAWHEREYPGEAVDRDDCYEIDADKATMIDGDPYEDRNKPRITMRAEMDRMLAAGEAPPFLVAVDGHYA